MISQNDALRMIQQTVDTLHESGLLESALTVTESTPLLGTGATLDSLGFVNLVSELEERVNEATKGEHSILVTEIPGMDGGESSLTAGILASYISQITA